MGGWEKKQGNVTEKINCAKTIRITMLRIYKKQQQCAINSHPSLLDSFAIKQAHIVI